MEVNRLLELLDNEKISRKICEIVNQNIKNNKGYNDFGAEHSQKDVNEIECQHQKIIEQLRLKIKDNENEILDLQNENYRLEKAYRELEEKLVNDHRDKEKLLVNMEKETKELRIQKIALEKELEKKNKEVFERFSKGWQLYKEYSDVSASVRRLLSGVICKDSFEAFIVGIAKDDSLHRLWDETYQCIRIGNSEDALILWNIFMYAMYLVNQAKSEDLYVLAQIKKGDVFDIEYHRLAGDTRFNQGSIESVTLLGFINTFNGEAVRKSIVKVS